MTRSVEFQLATECCKAAFPRARPSEVPSHATDWAHFSSLVAFHRIEGLAWHAVSCGFIDPPQGAREQLRLAAARIAATNLRASLDCRTLRDRFERAGVPLLFLKGLTLGCLSYGNAALKDAVDVDILVDPTDLRASAELLRELDYRLLVPKEPRLGLWHRDWKESVWASRRLQLDLHTSVADNRALVPEITVHSPAQSVEIAEGTRLSTLATDQLFAYLAVHGASSAWFRLKWISDFAALLDHCDQVEVGRLYERSLELGAGRAAGQAFLLADHLFGSLSNCASLRMNLMRDGATRRLCNIALRFLTRPPREPTARALGTLPIHGAQFLLMPGLSFKAAELSSQGRRFLWRARS